MAKSRDELGQTKRLMGALLRMPPKPHEDMKVGKARPKQNLGKVAKPTKAKTRRDGT
jgi:hypothetical protein